MPDTVPNNSNDNARHHSRPIGNAKAWPRESSLRPPRVQITLINKDDFL